MVRWIVMSAIALWMIALGCVLLPGAQTSSDAKGEARTDADVVLPSTRATDSGGLPFRSVCMQIQRLDWIDKYCESMDEIAAIGADTVLLVVDTRQENGKSSRIYLDLRMTPTVSQMDTLIRHAKSIGLRVIVMPVVLLDKPRGNEWRGNMEPDSWDEWFDSYREMISHFAYICEGNGVDMLVIGSELVSSTRKRPDSWRDIIATVRGIYKGKLTYSSNWDVYADVPFWDALDLVGMNSYWMFGKQSTNEQPTVDQIKHRWGEIQSSLIPFIEKTGKPLFFTEVGWCSMANMAYEPWDYTKTSPGIDLDLQKRLYEGFFQSWQNQSALAGYSIWQWPPGEGGEDDRGYTPEGKPAMGVLKEWLGKPRWQVK